ncbi:hypothetical protein SAMN05216267_105311 [Actinacidiphila rubida]|uniref:Uncharacterized protein n=1 Tax=Actinacidiphila rubida TaxID=310780 RepID=A0A1H8TGV2_9ACTN|nr:hypothetical protein [Actinacidiphila rubida]SEO90127.1 hypothetical protein SAMN05216267_105311 [Actinacidiphila rubida]
MSRLPNRRDEEVRRLLDTPHPAVPVDLAARAMLRGRRIVHRRRIEHSVLWALLAAAVIAGIVLTVLNWPHSTPPVPNDGTWWSPNGPD